MTVRVGERPVVFMTPREIACQIAVVPQDTPVDVPFTAAEMAMLGRYARWGAWGQETAEDKAVVKNALERMGAVELANRFLAQLSGGERQWVILGRALA